MSGHPEEPQPSNPYAAPYSPSPGQVPPPPSGQYTGVAFGPAPTSAPTKRGMKGWQTAAIAAGTGVIGLVVGVGIGSGGGDEAPAAAPTTTEAPSQSTQVEGAEADDADTKEPSSSPDVSDEPAAAAPDSADEGTRDNPFPIGTPVSNGEWDVTLGEPREAWGEIQAANQFNDPPPEGMEFYVIPVTATYQGDETGLAWVDLTVEFVGSDARTYTDRCGVIPADLMDVAELYAGGVAEGNVCVTVPSGADGLWTLSTGWGGNTVFFASGE